MNAKVIFTKDFMEKAKYKDLTYRQRGRIWLERFLILENEGKNIYKSRVQLGHAVGIEDPTRAYGWVNNIVRRGYVKEISIDNGMTKFVSTSKVKLYGKRKTRKVAPKQATLPLVPTEVVLSRVVEKPSPITIKYREMEIIVNNTSEAIAIAKGIWS